MMLKWTTRGSLNDSDSAQVQFPGVDKSTVQAFSSVITQLTRVSNPAHTSVDSDKMDDLQRQIKHTQHEGSGRHASAAFTTSTTSPPRRRAFLRGLKRSSSLSRGDRDPVESQSFRHGSSRSLPSSPQTSQSTDDRQKKTGVLEKFRKLFRTTKSANKTYQTDSAGKLSPGRTRRRSRSPVKKQDTGNVKGPSSSKTRLTRLIETKREERKQTRSNASIQQFAHPYKSESISSDEEHPYVQHGQLDNTLFLHNESSLRSDARERVGYELPAPKLRQNPQGHGQSTKVNSTVFSRNTRFAEFEASFQRQLGHVACLQRSSSLRLSINEHSLQYSKAGMFDQKNPDSFTNPQRRRWSSQSTNIALRSSNYEEDCQPSPNVLPRSGSVVMTQLANKPSCSEESLFQFGESLVTVIEAGSLRKVKVMPSKPDTIIQVKKSLSPVYRNPPLTYHEVITQRKAAQDVKDKFRWSVTADGGMVITPTKESCRPDTTNLKQSDLVTHTGIPWPRNNNNGRAKMYGSTNLHPTGQETSDTFFKTCDVNEESAIHDGPMHVCVAPSRDDALEFATTRQENKGVDYESPVGLHVDTDGKGEISRVRVKDIVKSIEEQCETVRKRGFPDYTQTILLYGDMAGVGSETCRSTDTDHLSGSPSAIPPGWIKDPGQEIDNKVNDTCPTIKRTHNYSSCESEGFSPKVCSSVSEARCSFPLISARTVMVQADSKMDSPTESDICESPANTRTCSSVSPQSSYTPSIPSDMINDTWTLPSDVQGIFSDSSDVDSLVRNIAVTNKATKPTGKASTANHSSDKASDQNKETDQVMDENQECNNIFRSEELTKREIKAPETELYDVTKESLVSLSRRDVSSPVSIILSTNNLEEGITDVKAPLTMVPQDSSAMEGTEDSNADVLEEQLSDLSVHQQQNSVPAKMMFQASYIQSSMAERHLPRCSLLQQKSPALGQREHSHPIISEVKQTESMHSKESDSENTGFPQTSDFEQEQGEQVNPIPLPDEQIKLLQPHHLHGGQTELPVLTVLPQERPCIFRPTSTNTNYERLLHKGTEFVNVQRKSQALTSSSSQADSCVESWHETVYQATGESGRETNEVHDCGESLEQTNRTIGETTPPKPTQAQSSKPTQLSEKVDSTQPKSLIVESSTPSILQCGNVEISSKNIQSGKVGSLKLTDSLDGPDAPMASPCVANEHGFRSGDDKPSLNVKPKKKVSFNLSASQQDNVSSLSDVAVIEVAPRMTATPVDQQNEKGVMEELDHSDNVSSTDVSCSFSLRSNDGQGMTQQVTSTSGDDLTWWAPDVAEEMNFFHDEVNDKAVNDKAVNDKAVNGKTVNDKDVKNTEDEHNTDAIKRPVNLNLLTTHAIDREGTNYSSMTSLSQNEAVNSIERKRSNALNNKRNEIYSWLKNEAAEFPTSTDGHNISDRKSDGNKATTSAGKLDGKSDKNVPEKIQEHLPLPSMISPKEPSKCQKRDVCRTDPGITNRDGKGHKTDHGITNRDGSVHKIHFGITNRDGNVHKTDADITNVDLQVHLPDSDIKNKDWNVHITDSDVTNDEINVHPTDSDTTNEDRNVHLAVSDITNEERNGHLNDPDFTDEDENDSLSDTNSRTYDVSGTLARYKKVTAPWWEKPEVVVELSLENSASEDEEYSTLPEELNQQQTAQTASRLSEHLQRSPPKSCGIHGDNKLYDQEIILPLNRTLQHFRSQSPSNKSPKMYFKQASQQERSRKHSDNQTEQMADTASVHLHCSSESVKLLGRNCMRIVTPRKRQELLTGERKRFVFTKRTKRATGSMIMKANNDNIKSSCDGDQEGQFEFRTRSRVNNPVSVKTGQGRYSSKSRGPYEVANKTQTCNRRAGKTSLLNDASSPGNVPSRGHLLAEDMSPSSPSIATKRRNVLAHIDCRSSLGHCGKTIEQQTYEVVSSLQQTRIRGMNPQKRLNVINGPSQTKPSKCVKSISLVDEETVLTRDCKHSPADIHHAITPQTTPKAPNHHPKPISSDSSNSLGCVTDDEHGQDIHSKTRHRKNQEKHESRVHSRRGINAASDLLDSYLKQDQLVLDNPSQSEGQERDNESDDEETDNESDDEERENESDDEERENESDDEEKDSDSEGQERQCESSLLKQCQQQPTPDCSACSFGTKKACRQDKDVLDIRAGCSQTDHISQPIISTSQHSHNDWSRGSKSPHRNLARPGVLKFHYKRKSGLNESTYTSKVRSDSPKTRHCSTDWPNSPASKCTGGDWFEASSAQYSYVGQGDASTTPKSRLDSQPGQWLFIATFFVFQIFLHWLYAR